VSLTILTQYLGMVGDLAGGNGIELQFNGQFAEENRVCKFSLEKRVKQ